MYRIVFKTNYSWNNRKIYGDVDLYPFTFEVLDDSPDIRDWLVEHEVVWQTCVGETVRPWEDEAAIDRWIEFEDPEMAVLFKLRWC